MRCGRVDRLWRQDGRGAVVGASGICAVGRTDGPGGRRRDRTANVVQGPTCPGGIRSDRLGCVSHSDRMALAVSVGRRWWARWWAMRHGFAFSHRPHRSEPPRGVESFDNWQMLTFVHYSATGQISDRSARLLFYRNWFGARWRYAHRHVFTVTLPTALPGLTIGPNLHTRTRGEHIIFDDDDRSDFARYLPVFSPAPDVARRVLTRSVRDRLGDLAARSSVVRITVLVVVGDKLHAVCLNTSQPHGRG